MIHPLSDCMNTRIPESTRIWQFCVIFPDCEIGENCNICANVLVENDVRIGNNVTVKSGVQLWDGVELEDGVCVGPNVTFTNDRYPKAGNKDYVMMKTRICKGASIGANSTVLPGVTIGENAMVGAGSVVTKDIPAGELWIGNPARFVRMLNNNDNQLVKQHWGGVICSCFSYSFAA